MRPASDAGRSCAWCGCPLPADAHPLARYCSKRHCGKARRERKAALAHRYRDRAREAEATGTLP